MFTRITPRLRFVTEPVAPETPAPGTPGTPAEPETPPTPPAKPAATPAAPKHGDHAPTETKPSEYNPADPENLTADDIAQLQPWARKAIEKANKDAATARTRKNEAQADAYRKIGVELGIVKENEKDLTPEELANRLRDENGTLKIANTANAEKLAGYKRRDAIAAAATLHSGDTPLLIPYLNGLPQFTTLDINADDYDARVAEIVLAEVTKNPKLKVAPVVPQSTGDTHPSGDPAPTGDESIESIRENRRKRRGTQLA